MTTSEKADLWRADRLLGDAAIRLHGIAGCGGAVETIDMVRRSIRDQIARDSVLTSDSLVADLADAGQVDAEMRERSRKVLLNWTRYETCRADV